MVLSWNEVVCLSRNWNIEPISGFLFNGFLFVCLLRWVFFFAEQPLDLQTFCHLLLLPSLQSWVPTVCPLYCTIFILISQTDVISHIIWLLSDSLMGECRHRPNSPHWCSVHPPEPSGDSMSLLLAVFPSSD